MATLVRAVKRYQASEWFTDVFAQSANAEKQTTIAHDVRQESRFLRNEVDCQTKWDQYSTELRLADRIGHVRKWIDVLERTVQRLDKEIADLSDAKENIEASLDDLNTRTDATIECLTLREARRKLEVVKDDPETQLHKEMELIESVRKSLNHKFLEAFEQLCLLQEARQEAQVDLQAKVTAVGIDIDQLNLSDRSPGITYKTDPLRVPHGSMSAKQSAETTSYNQDRADGELRTSSRLREQILNLLNTSRNQLHAQAEAAEFALRKRIHETQHAIDELLWQKKQTQDEMTDLTNEIRGLEEAVKGRKRATQLAETRLDNRTRRTGVELCCDAAFHGLVDEVKQLQASTKALEAKLERAQQILDELGRTSNRLTDDVALKTQTLTLDKQCMDIRLKLKPAARKETDNNMLLVGLERPKAQTLA